MNFGFSPVRNLSGHGLGKFEIHTNPNIPNYDNGDETEIKKGDIFAIEPFATNGHGIVIETSNPTVFSFVQKKPVRDMTTRQILKGIENYKGLPFAKWWLEEKFPSFRVNLALRQLENLGIIKGYSPLADRDNGLVSQAENTILVKENKAVILTKSD